jgi:excisionase family DNA binding protein
MNNRRNIFFTTGAAARLVGISPYTIRAELEAGRIRGMKLSESGQWRVRVDDLEAWLRGRYLGRAVSIDRITGELVFAEPALAGK